MKLCESPSLCHRETAVGIYIQYILLASRYVLLSTFSSTIMYNIHVKKYSLFALRSPCFLFFDQDEMIHIKVLQVLGWRWN